jgi:hypothetical protein
MSGIDHTVVYLGNNQIAAHATSHNGVAWNWGNSSSTITFFIHITLPDSIVPTAPSNVSPAANTLMTNLTPRLTANAFTDGAIGSTQVAAEWQIFNGSALVYDTGTDATNLLGLTVPVGKLLAGNTYNWKVRYEDNYGGWSSYSAPTSLTTVAATVAGDYNNNGVVDPADYVVWRSTQGTNSVLLNDPTGGTIGSAQLDTWRAHFGQTASSGSAAIANAAIPEPGTLALFIVGALAISARPRVLAS